MTPHALYTKFIAHPGQGPELVQVLTKSYHISSTAKGCRVYVVNQDTEHPDHIWVTELWDTPEDHVVSQSLDGAKELTIQTQHLLATEPQEIVLKPLVSNI